MPNIPVPAPAEGVPTDAIVRNRLRELMKEISVLLDRTSSGASSFVTIHAASSGRASTIGFDLDPADEPLSSLLIKSEDQLGEAESFIDLVAYAMEGMAGDREINALQYGIAQVRKSVNLAHETIERARSQI